MRALSYYSYADPRFPAQLADVSDKEIYKRRKAAIKHFRKLLPILDPAEKPISSVRKE